MPESAPSLKKSLTQVFSCEFCRISEKTFFYRTPPLAPSGLLTTFHKLYKIRLHYNIESLLEKSLEGLENFHFLHCLK